METNRVLKALPVRAKHVLCVEDDADTRDMLEFMLDMHEFEVVVAPDAEAALRMMEHQRFSLYVLDSGLPNVSGLSLCERIRAADARTPIIIFSGHAHISDINAGMRAGATAYLIKPDTSKLVPTIRRLLKSDSE